MTITIQSVSPLGHEAKTVSTPSPIKRGLSAIKSLAIGRGHITFHVFTQEERDARKIAGFTRKLGQLNRD